MGTVVYNASFGGFGLSLAAQKLYLEKKGHTPKLHKGQDVVETHWYIDKPYDHYAAYIDRADPLLAEVVQELGDAANGEGSNLIVVYLPNGTAYKIDEYNGYENIEIRDEIKWHIAG